MRLATDMLELLFPAACEACNKPCAQQHCLCDGCRSTISTLADAAACSRCASPVHSPGSPCPWCKGKGMSPFAQIVSLSLYEPPLSDLIVQMKYRRRWPLAQKLGDLLLEQEAVANLLQESDVLVPVPLHWRRHIARGYNQADLLACALGAPFKLPRTFPVKRVRDTPQQALANSPTERTDNMKHAFRLTRPRTIAGKRVVIIDDVMTTGSTLRAVARQVKRARPASISAIVLCVADPRNRSFAGV